LSVTRLVERQLVKATARSSMIRFLIRFIY
jgi:hypothetical protein